MVEYLTVPTGPSKSRRLSRPRETRGESRGVVFALTMHDWLPLVANIPEKV